MSPQKVIFPHELPAWSNIKDELINLKEICLASHVCYPVEELVNNFQKIYESVSACYGSLNHVDTSLDKESTCAIPKPDANNEDQMQAGARRRRWGTRKPRLSPTCMWLGLSKYLNKVGDEERQKFIKVTLPTIVDLALQLERVAPPQGLQYIQQQSSGTVVLSRQCVASIIAAAFLCLFEERERNRQGKLNVINFSHFFKHLPLASQVAKLRCILHYFDRVSWCQQPLVGSITFTRQVVHQDALPLLEDILRSDAELCPLEIHHDGFIEDMGCSSLQVDFANKCIGGGVLGRGRVQEEIRFCTCPELIASLLFMESMQDNEAIIISGLQQFSQTAGYAAGLEFAGDFVDTAEEDEEGSLLNMLVAMDATPFHCRKSLQYTEAAVLRELHKAVVGFCDAELAQQHFPPDWDSRSSSHSEDNFVSAAEEQEGHLEEQRHRHLSVFAIRLLRQSLTAAFGELARLGGGGEGLGSSEGGSSLISTSSSSDPGLEIPPIVLASSGGSSPRAGESANSPRVGFLTSPSTGGHNVVQEFGDLPAFQVPTSSNGSSDQVPTSSNGSSDHLLEMDYSEFLANYRRRSSNLSDITSRRSSSSTKYSSDLSSDLEEIYESFLHMEKCRHMTIAEEVCNTAVTDFAARMIASVMTEGTLEAAQMLPGMQCFGDNAPKSNVIKPQALRLEFPAASDSEDSNSDELGGNESGQDIPKEGTDLGDLEEYAHQVLEVIIPEALQTAVSLQAANSSKCDVSPRCPTEQTYREYAERIVQEVFLRVAHDMAIEGTDGRGIPPAVPVQIGGLSLFARDGAGGDAALERVFPVALTGPQSPTLPEVSIERCDISVSSNSGSDVSGRSTSPGRNAPRSLDGVSVGPVSSKCDTSSSKPPRNKSLGSPEAVCGSPALSLRDVQVVVASSSHLEIVAKIPNKGRASCAVSNLSLSSLQNEMDPSSESEKMDTGSAGGVQSASSSKNNNSSGNSIQSVGKSAAKTKSDLSTGGQVASVGCLVLPATTLCDNLPSVPTAPTEDQTISSSAFTSAILPPPSASLDPAAITSTSDLPEDVRTVSTSLHNPHHLSGASGNIPPGLPDQASCLRNISKKSGSSTTGDSISNLSKKQLADSGCSMGDGVSRISRAAYEGGASSGVEEDRAKELNDTAALIVHRVFESLPDHLDKLSDNKHGYKPGKSGRGCNTTLSSEGIDPLLNGDDRSLGGGGASGGGHLPAIGLLTKKLSREILTNAFLKVERRRPLKAYERRSSEPCHFSVQLSIQAFQGSHGDGQYGDRQRRMSRTDDDLERVRDSSRRGSLDSYNLSNRRMSSGFQDPVLSKFAEELMKADMSVPPLLLPRRDSSTSTATSHRSSLSGFRDPVLASLETELLNSSFGSITSPRQGGARPKYTHSQSLDARMLRPGSVEAEQWFPMPRRVGTECLEEMSRQERRLWLESREEMEGRAGAESPEEAERLEMRNSQEDLEEFADIISSNILQQAASVLSWEEEEGAVGGLMDSSPRTGGMHPLAHSSRQQSLSGAGNWAWDDDFLEDLPVFSDHLAREIIRDALEEVQGGEATGWFQVCHGHLSSDTVDTELTNHSDFLDALDIPYHRIESLADCLAQRVVRMALRTLQRHFLCKGQLQSRGRSIATGNWGCGAFGGDVHLKAVLQWVAASLVQAPVLQYFTFCHSRLADLDKLLRTVRCREWRVRDLMRHVCAWCTLAVQEAAGDEGRNCRDWSPSVSLFDYLLSAKK